MVSRASPAYDVVREEAAHVRAAIGAALKEARR